MQAAPSLSDRLNATRNRPVCAACDEFAIATFEFCDRYGRFPVWGRTSACDAHFNELIDEVQGLEYVKWLD